MQRLGRYTLGRVLGRGGQGVVYEATTDGPGEARREVAVKVLRGGGDTLRREARLGGLLRHRHLVDVFEVAEVDGVWFCAMELCSGGSLRGRAPLPPRAVVEVGLAVCNALQYAHEDLRLVHLDLKPDNLLLADGVVKVADLGIARAHGFDQDGRPRGSPGYMAPEQARGGPVDARTDVYALGVTLAELASGRPRGPAATFDWASPAAVGGDVPEWLAPVVRRCLEDDPGARWPDMDALATALRALAVDGSGLADVLGTDERRGPPRSAEAALLGRDGELGALEAWLAAPGIVVVKGPPGIGKSRLARACVERWRSGPTFVCDLSTARSSEGLASAVASALDLPLGPGDPAAHVRQLAHALSTRGDALVLLDGLDGVDDPQEALTTWGRSTAARLLVTARARPDLPDARVLDLGPLGPEAAAALVVDRARRRGVDVAVHPRLGELVARLDGVPLALELAAGRTGVLSLEDVIDRLGLALLRGDGDDRRGALAAALDACWEALTPIERSALAQLSVFAGGFDLDAALQVVDLGGASVGDALAGLCDSSVVSERGPGRWGLLGAAHEHAAGKLGGDPDPATRHGRAFARHGTEEALVGLRRPGGSTLRARLGAELDNLFVACERAVARGDATVAVGTLRAVWGCLEMRGPFGRAVRAASAVVGMPALSVAERCGALHVLAQALDASGDPAGARERAREGLALAREARDPHAEGRALVLLAALTYQQGLLVDARAEAEAALAHADPLRDAELEAVAKCVLAAVAIDRGALGEARARFQEVLTVQRSVGNRYAEAMALGNLAVVDIAEGRSEAARERLEAALRLHRDTGDRRHEGSVLGNLASVAIVDGRTTEARTLFLEALAVHRHLGNRRSEGIVMGNLGMLALHEGRTDDARRYGARALAIHREVGDVLGEALEESALGDAALADGHLDEARAWYGASAERYRRLGSPLEGRALGRLARVCAIEGNVAAARAMLDEGERLLRLGGDEVEIAWLFAARAEVLARAGDPEGARGASAAAEGLAPRHPDVRSALARAAAVGRDAG